MRLWRDAHLRISITRWGLAYLATLLLVGFFAANTGNNLLYLVFGWMASLFIVSGWVSRKALRDFKPAAVEAPILFARVKSTLRMRFRDAAPARVRALELQLSLDRGTSNPTFHPGGGRDTTPRLSFAVRPEQRGPLKLQALELCTRYPFGFLEKTQRFDWSETCWVAPHPRVGSFHLDDRSEAIRPHPHPGQTSPEGTRPFRLGDTPARVHWKRTAQRGSPWVRTFEEERSEGLHLNLDLTAWTPGPAFEAELESLSGLILQARLQKRTVTLSLRDTQGHRDIQGHEACWRALASARAEGFPSSSIQPPSPGPIQDRESVLP